MPAVALDLVRLRERLAPLGVTTVRPLAGGASSLTYLASGADGTQLVVKVAPPGVAPVHHRDVLRQARMMKVLRGTRVPVPAVVWKDRGDPPGEPPLFVTSFVAGSSLEPLFDLALDLDGTGDGGHDDAAIVAERMCNAARTLAALHAVDPDHLGFANEPRVGLGEEVDRWCRLLETVDPGLAPGWEDVAAALRAVDAVGQPPAVVHGDFRLGNLLADGATVTAVIDWEIWTIGDPRVDLGWFLANADPLTYRRNTPYAASLPSPADLAGVYAEALGREVPDQLAFRALACFKSTATWSLIVKHNRRRPTPDPALEEMATVLPHLLDRAAELLAC